MSKEAYIRGFCKVAEENGYNPFELARMAVGFRRLKKAEAKLFVKDLRKLAYWDSRPPTRLTAPNLRRPSSTPSCQTCSRSRLQAASLRRPSSASTAASAAPAASSVKAQPTVSRPPQPDLKPEKGSFSDLALRRGWTYSNGTWTSPNGQSFTNSQVGSRIRLRKKEKEYNQRAERRRAAGIPLPTKPSVGPATDITESNAIRYF